VSTLNKRSDLQAKAQLEHIASFRRGRLDSVVIVDAEGREIVVEGRKEGSSGIADDRERECRALAGSKLEL
jgi:hypothetical protein